MNQRDSEFIAAQPGDRTMLRQRATDALSGGLEDKIATVMTEHVVDLPKLVDPDDQHGKLGILADARNHRRDLCVYLGVDFVVRRRAAWQAGAGARFGKMA